jgi:hypothetical protein
MSSPSIKNILKYPVPIIAVLVIIVHFVLVKSSNLNKWKGGGFGMYSEVHYYFNDLVIDDLNKPLDSLIIEDRNIASFIMDVKRMPNNGNLHKMAELASKYVSSDTIKVQVWKPVIDAKNSTYSRELINRYQFIKP